MRNKSHWSSLIAVGHFCRGRTEHLLYCYVHVYCNDVILFVLIITDACMWLFLFPVTSHKSFLCKIYSVCILQYHQSVGK